MYLIDISVWIDSLRQVDNPPVRFFKSLIASQAHDQLAQVCPELKCAPMGMAH